ncbi:cyclopropane-fatty-acyl-phospholipid synthase, partial [Aspergillus sp. HF37]
MASAILSFVYPYAQQLALNALGRISGAHLKVIIQYQDPPEVIRVGDINGPEQPESTATLIVRNPSLWLRICSCFDIGFAEAYMFQEVDCDDLSKIFDIYINNRSRLGSGNPIFQLLPRLEWLLQPSNSTKEARENISSHYDISNKLFAAFLSPDMNYSCAHWEGSPFESLEKAQTRKAQNLLRKAQISSSCHVLDIGCGWGDLAIKAAQTTGCRVTGLTLSDKQKSLADQRIKEAGLDDRVHILLRDYRDVSGPEDNGGFYDRVISVGMFEHVGPGYLDQYFAIISRLLHPTHGLMVVDGITMTSMLRETKSNLPNFIGRYVFPGGYLPTIHMLLDSLHRGSSRSLEATFVQNIGPHYGRTLLAWRENFLRNWKTIELDYRAAHHEASDSE